MNGYEKRIGLKSIYLTFVRHFIEMIIIFVPIAIVSLIVTIGFIPTSYSSNITFSKDTTFTTVHYEKLISTVTSVECYASITKTTGVAAKDVKEGISYPTEYLHNASTRITISFKSTKKNIVQPVLNAIANYTEEVLTPQKDYETLKCTKAGDIQSTNSGIKYLLIALAVDLVVSLGVPFIFEIVGDQVYDRDDIEYLGCGGFEISASKAK